MGSIKDRNSKDLTEAEEIKKRWQEYMKNYTEKALMTQTTQWGPSPRVRHPGVWSQMGLRKHYYKQSQWKWCNSSWAISNPKRWCCESAALNMPANLENSAVAKDRKRSVFIPTPKKWKCQLLSHVQLFVTPWTVAHQAPLSTEFSR